METWMEKMLDRRSYREFTEEKVPEEILDQLMAIAQRTPTSTGMQQASIIRVQDPQVRQALVAVGKQEYVARAPEVWVFLVDNYRNAKIYQDKTGKRPFVGPDVFLAGFTDAVLMASRVMTGLELSGLGGCFLGNILNHPLEVARILDLPERTFPALGIIFGYPNQHPQLKPRMGMENRFFLDAYQDRDFTEALKDYDEEMQTYYDLREANRRVDSFSKQVVRGLEKQNPIRNGVFLDLAQAGYDGILSSDGKRDRLGGIGQEDQGQEDQGQDDQGREDQGQEEHSPQAKDAGEN